MVEFLDNLLSQIDPLTAYAILFISAFIENTFPPIPGDAVTVLGAYLAATNRLGFWGVYLSTSFGSVFGFFFMYLIGRQFGRAFIKSKFRAKIFSEAQIVKVEKWFARWGYWVIAGNRFLAGTRSVISLFSGLFHLHWVVVLALSTLSALVWNGLLIYGGFLVGVNWPLINTIISQYNYVVIALTIAVITYFTVRHYRKKKLLKQNDSTEITD